MDEFSVFHNVIEERISNPDANYYEPFWWDKELKVLLADIGQSIKFIEESCTDEELYFLGEVMDDFIDQSQSKEFLECVKKRADRVINPLWKDEIIKDIQEASAYLRG